MTMLDFFAVFMLLSIFFGGAGDLFQTISTVLLAGWGVSTICLNNRQLPPRTLLWGIAVPCLLAFAWSLIQILPLGQGNPAYALVAPALWPALSLDVSATAFQLCYALALALTAYGIFGVARQAHNAALLLRLLATVFVLVGLYGLIAYAAGNTHVLWLPKYAYHASLTATFINHNHYATFGGVGVLVCLALFMERIGEISSRMSLHERLRALVHLVLLPRWPWLLAAVVLFVTVMLSTSRAGVAATVAGVSFLMLFLAMARKPVRWFMVALWVAGVLAGSLLMQLAGHGVGSRLQRLDSDSTLRQNIYATTGKAINAHAWTGQGLGTFKALYAQVDNPEQSATRWSLVEHAHNTYLELAAEMGLPAAFMLALATLVAAAYMAAGLFRRRRMVVWPALGLSVLVLTGSHALADFSLSVPAVATATLALLAAALAQSRATVAEAQENPEKTEKTPPAPAKAMLAFQRMGACLLAVPVIGYALLQTGAEVLATPARHHIGQYLQAGVRKENYDVAQMSNARAGLLRAQKLMPWRAEYPAMLAQMDMAMATDTALPLDEAARLLQESRAGLERSLALAPVNGLAWYRLAWVQNVQGHGEEAEASLVASLLANPSDLTLSMARLPMLLQLYGHMPPDDKTLATAHLQNLWDVAAQEVKGRLRNRPAEAETLRMVLAGNPSNAESWQKLMQSPLGEAGGAR